MKKLEKNSKYRILCFCVPLIFIFITSTLGDRTGAEQLNLVEKSVRESTIQFYALEGRYPDSLSELVEQYGLSIDNTQYFVDYQFIGSNILPNIAVLTL